MNTALTLSAFLMGLASAPHCLAMCGPICGGIAKACGGPHPQQAMLALQLGRLLSYGAAGAVAAASVSALGTWSTLTPAVRPLWVLAQLAALALGLWLLWRGQVPLWMQRMGQGLTSCLQQAGQGAARWQVWRASLFGLLWAALPCGLLQAALVVAAFTASPWQGAVAMAAFAFGSAIGLWAGPALWWRLSQGRVDARTGPLLAVRASGLMLAAVSAWGVGMSVWQRLNPAVC
jgi:uncharacterized protein